jgi:uncharacterized membrane-anchored protein
LKELTPKLNKVAQITLAFWLLKVIATTLGETLGDFLSMTLNLGYITALLLTLAFFLAVFSFQMFQKYFKPFIFWLVIIGTTTLGTEISDFIDRTLHWGYAPGSMALAGCLAITLLIWSRFFNMEVYPIQNRKKEAFYWTAILFSNSLGTAFGDYLSDNIGLSYLEGAFITAGIIVLVIILHYFTRLNAILLFWIAFIFTRPFGATFGDFLTKPLSMGGLDLGTYNAALICALLMTIIIFFTPGRNQKSPADPH